MYIYIYIYTLLKVCSGFTPRKNWTPSAAGSLLVAWEVASESRRKEAKMKQQKKSLGCPLRVVLTS